MNVNVVINLSIEEVSDMKRQTKKQKAWSELIKSVVSPPKRYNHQPSKNHTAKIIQLRNKI